ncbi:unnamed protein product [Urochloa humidicola]
MGEKMKMRRHPLLPLVPVAKTTQRQARTFPPPLPLPAVELVSHWGIINAVAFGATFAVFFALYIINPCVPTWMLVALGHDLSPDGAPPPPDDAAKDAKATAMVLVAFLCTVAQAAAAAPALLLAARLRLIRRALAYVVLAAAVGSHCMYFELYDFQYPVFIRIARAATIFFFAAGDLLCVLALLVGSHE